MAKKKSDGPSRKPSTPRGARAREVSMPQALDPRLKRLCSSLKLPVRLKQDLDRGFLTAAVATEAALPEPEELTKRVLVLLDRETIPSGFEDLYWTPIIDRTYTVAVPISRIEELGRHADVKFVEAGRRLVPMLDTSVAETRADLLGPAPLGLRGAGVIVGVIDVGGLDYTLDDFRNADGTTRVAFLWDQRIQPVQGEQAPAGFGYGVEYTAATINQALNQPNPFQRVRHRSEPASHATHVTSIAAGNGRSGDADFPAGRFVGVAPEATIVFVEAGPEGNLGSFTDSVRVADAIAYVYRKAQELGLPCVINMSLGQNGGSHDGESVVERAIDRLAETPGRAFVLAGGNEHVFRGHASGTLATGQSRTLRWKFGGRLPLPGGGVLPAGQGDRTSNELEIWYSSRDRLRVSLASPDGQVVGPVEPGSTLDRTLTGGVSVFIDSVRFAPLNGDNQIYIEVSPPPGVAIPEGTWEVRLEAIASRVGRFDAWIERDARDPNNRFADQSFFVGNDFDPTMTLGTPSTGRRSIAVANYNHRTESPEDSSGRGTTRDGRPKPEIAAPGTDILAAHAQGGRTRSASQGGGVWPMRTPKTGTSMASPHVAGIVALLLQRNPRLTIEQIRKMLIASTREASGISGFDIAWGFGRIDAQGAVDLA